MGSLKKKFKKYAGKALDIMGKDPVVGSFITSPSERKDIKDIERSTAALEGQSAAPKKTMQEIARSRAAGAGTFNYKEQVEM